MILFNGDGTIKGSLPHILYILGLCLEGFGSTYHDLVEVVSSPKNKNIYAVVTTA